jgi:hypothetical protein
MANVDLDCLGNAVNTPAPVSGRYLAHNHLNTVERAFMAVRPAPGDAPARAADHDAIGSVNVTYAWWAAGLFLFQQGRSASTEKVFRALADETGGAYFQFNPAVEPVAEKLLGLLEAVTHFAIGGALALETQNSDSAALLLNQINNGALPAVSGHSERQEAAYASKRD